MKCFGGLKVGPDVEWVILALMLQSLLAFCKCGIEERITIRSKNNLIWTEVERNDKNVLTWNRKTIDYAIGDILIAHGFNHAGNDNRTGNVVTA